MRTSILAIATLAAFASPAFAQDRTLPAGAYLAAQPPIDTIAAPVASTTPALEGRSVGENPVPVARPRSHRHH